MTEDFTTIEFAGIRKKIRSSLLERRGFICSFCEPLITVTFLRQKNGEFKPISAVDVYKNSCWGDFKHEKLKVVGDDLSADDIPI